MRESVPATQIPLPARCSVLPRERNYLSFLNKPALAGVTHCTPSFYLIVMSQSIMQRDETDEGHG